MLSDDNDFHEHLQDYLDVDGAIDYLLFLYITGLERNASKDLVLLKYHDYDVWIPSVYDMERAFGLGLDGEYISENVFVPVKKDNTWESGTNSMLWDRLLQTFETEIRARYTELRQTVLIKENMASHAAYYIDAIPVEYYMLDLEIWPRSNAVGTPLEQITMYMQNRLEILDNLFSMN